MTSAADTAWPRGELAPRVGVYGGTFNPIHVGHLRAAEEVAEGLGLERVVFVPSARPPHKAGADPADPIAPARLRFDWVRRAVADRPGFEADPIEVEREGPSFLVDTLEAFARRLHPVRPVFVLGCDAFQEMGTWRQPRKLFTLAHFAVTTRPPLQVDLVSKPLSAWLPECVRDDVVIAPDGRSGAHREAGTRILLVPITALDVSATGLRSALREGRSLRYLVHEAIREEIEQSGVYGDTASDAAGGQT